MGTVAMSAPSSAAWVTWLGVRTDAVMISTVSSTFLPVQS